MMSLEKKLEEAEHLIRHESYEVDYDVEHELGRGKFAIVKRCVHKKTRKVYAAKLVRKHRSNTHGRSGREQLLMEISVLSRSTHPKMVRLYDVFETRHEMQIILEFAEGGDLHRHCIETDVARTEKEICYLIRQILEATKYLHDEKIVHLDLKPDNILLAKKCEVFPEIRLIDFGLSRSLEGPYSQFDIVGTPEYVAPEVLAYDPIDYGSDMWSIGVVTYVLLSGISPFAGDDVMETYSYIGSVEYDFDCEEFDEISDEAINFIEKLLLRKPGDRMTAREALEHKWIKQLDAGVSAEDVMEAQQAKKEVLPEDLKCPLLGDGARLSDAGYVSSNEGDMANNAPPVFEESRVQLSSGESGGSDLTCDASFDDSPGIDIKEIDTSDEFRPVTPTISISDKMAHFSDKSEGGCTSPSNVKQEHVKSASVEPLFHEKNRSGIQTNIPQALAIGKSPDELQECEGAIVPEIGHRDISSTRQSWSSSSSPKTIRNAAEHKDNHKHSAAEEKSTDTATNKFTNAFRDNIDNGKQETDEKSLRSTTGVRLGAEAKGEMVVKKIGASVKTSDDTMKCLPPETKPKPITPSVVSDPHRFSRLLSPRSPDKVTNKRVTENNTNELSSNSLFKLKQSQTIDSDSSDETKENQSCPVKDGRGLKPIVFHQPPSTKSPPPPVAVKPKSPLFGGSTSPLTQKSSSSSPSKAHMTTTRTMQTSKSDTSISLRSNVDVSLTTSTPPVKRHVIGSYNEVASNHVSQEINRHGASVSKREEDRKGRPLKYPPPTKMKPSERTEDGELKIMSRDSVASTQKQFDQDVSKTELRLNLNIGGGNKKLSIGPLVSKGEHAGKKMVKQVTLTAVDKQVEGDIKFSRNRSCDAVSGSEEENMTLRQRYSVSGAGKNNPNNGVVPRRHSTNSGNRSSGSGKTYRRLYVTKVRNSKIYEHDFDIATEAAKIAQRVDKDVLPVENKLKSTDLKLLP